MKESCSVSKTGKSLDEINRRIGRGIKGIGIIKDRLWLSCTTRDYDCLMYGPRFKTRNEDLGERL